VLDLLYIAICVASLGATMAYLVGCERL